MRAQIYRQRHTNTHIESIPSRKRTEWKSTALTISTLLTPSGLVDLNTIHVTWMCRGVHSTYNVHTKWAKANEFDVKKKNDLHHFFLKMGPADLYITKKNDCIAFYVLKYTHTRKRNHISNTLPPLESSAANHYLNSKPLTDGVKLRYGKFLSGNNVTFIQSPISVKTTSNKSVMHKEWQCNLTPTVGFI